MPLERSGSDLDPIAWPPARPLRQLHAAAAFASPQGVDGGIGNDGRTLTIEISRVTPIDQRARDHCSSMRANR